MRQNSYRRSITPQTPRAATRRTADANVDMDSVIRHFENAMSELRQSKFRIQPTTNKSIEMYGIVDDLIYSVGDALQHLYDIDSGRR